ncbi:MAG TPA: family 20 glycosylhydrolase [Phycisphaerae bacterium]|nr:family 20 glycosylhydrolase [Phycisphaerae bacterium]
MAIKSVFVLTMCALGIQAAFGDTRGEQDARPAIVPRPVEMEVNPGDFELAPATEIFVYSQNKDVLPIAEFLAEQLEARTGYELDVAVPQYTGMRPNPPPEISLSDIPLRETALGVEGYTLTVHARSVHLRAAYPEGLFRGVHTLLQLLESRPGDAESAGAEHTSQFAIPMVRITDYPRYRWRGMLLDCGRHFMDKEFVKRYIDLLAYHKMNVLHWHLTEDQGWRIEIKKYPKLTEVGAWRDHVTERYDGAWRYHVAERYGGFYTQEDIKEIVAYAKSRYITVVPEIEMPGHSMAALASYPELGCVGEGYKVATRWGVHSDVYCAGNDKVFVFLQDVLSEVIELFPSEYIHIGGDECPKERWKECAKCQARIKAEGLEDEHELQSYFIRRIEKFLNSKGRRLIGWDEILEGGLAPNATVQSWRGMAGAIAAATTGHDVISSPTSHCYLDYAQVRMPGEPTWMGYLPLARTFSFEPTPKELTPKQARHVLGVEGNMWTEHAPQSRVDWQVFPRLCALAEVGWSPAELRSWDDFTRRMKVHYRRLDALGVTYFIPPPVSPDDMVFREGIAVTLVNPFGRGVIRYTLDGSEPNADSPAYEYPIPLVDTTTLKARTFLDSGRTSAVAEFEFRKPQPHQAVHVPGAQPGLAYEYYEYEGRWSKLPDFDKLERVAAGTVPTFDISMRKRNDHFAFRFRGYIEVPADGMYTFHLLSDDGSRLWIGSDLVVDHDGLHAPSEKSGQVILKPGKHPIRVEYFEAGGARRLEVSYEGPGTAKQPIPKSALWRSAESP